MPATHLLVRLRRDVGLVCVVVAVVAAIALYAPTLSRSLVNLDDPWLVESNWIVNDPSLHSVGTILFDTSRDVRVVLGAEFLPVRDLSVMLDLAVWGTNYGGLHLTNLLLYVFAIVGWFLALEALGVDRRIAGLTVLVWALHPTHAESVAWISERKGLLAAAATSLVVFGYARFRAGRSVGWLAFALVAAPLAVWSKALAAFAIAALGPLEIVLPASRVSWRRSLVGLAAVGAVTAAAFVPVLIVASRMSVVGDTASAPGGAGWFAMVLGVHGFYVRLASLTIGNAISYPIDSVGPATIDIVVGAIGLTVIAGAISLRSIRGMTPPAALRAAAVLWLCGWFPASRIILPVRLVVAADRYLLLPSLGVALVIAVGAFAIRRRSLAIVLVTAVCIASAGRTLVAQAAWRDSRSLWERAIDSNPHDAAAWSQYAEALADAGDPDAAERAAVRGFELTSSPRLELRRALLLARRGDRAGAAAAMRRAAEGGEPIAMTNLAVMLAEKGKAGEALTWARRAVEVAPLYVHGYTVLGRLYIALGRPEEARTVLERALALDRACTIRFELGRALASLGDRDAARKELLACFGDASLRAKIWSEIVRLSR